jgi:hypothetical protein
MHADAFMRRALRATALLNVGGALLFAFPDSIGRLAGLPGPVPRLYAWFIAFLVLLFGATYAWLARQPRIDRPLVAFCAIGKTGFVATVLVCWLLGDVPVLSVVTAGGDLLFAAIFTWWLIATRPLEAASTEVRTSRR